MRPVPADRRASLSLQALALDVETLGLAQGATRADLEKALTEHKPLAMAETIGLYQRQPK